MVPLLIFQIMDFKPPWTRPYSERDKQAFHICKEVHWAGPVSGAGQRVGQDPMFLEGEAIGHAGDVVAHRALAADGLGPAPVPARHLARVAQELGEEPGDDAPSSVVLVAEAALVSLAV